MDVSCGEPETEARSSASRCATLEDVGHSVLRLLCQHHSLDKGLHSRYLRLHRKRVTDGVGQRS